MKDLQELLNICENQLKRLEIKDNRPSDYIRGLNEGAEIILKDMIEDLKRRMRKWITLHY